MARRPSVALAILIAAACPALAQDKPADAPATETLPSLPVIGRGSTLADPFADRGSAVPSVLLFLQKQGTRLVSLGDEGGVAAYLGQGANGAKATLYVAPDGRHVVAGAMFDSRGRNVTSRQLGEMMTRFSEAAQHSGAGEVSIPVVPARDDLATGAFMDRFRNDDYVVTPFGSREGGLDAFLVQKAKPDENGRRPTQPFYVTPDGRHGIAGVVIREDGMMVTGLQLGKLRQELALTKATQEKGGSTVDPNAVNMPPVPDALFPTVVSAPTLAAPPAEPVQATSNDVAPVVPAPGRPTDARPATGGTAPLPSVSTGTPSEHAALYRSTGIDSRQLTDALKTTAFFSVGDMKAPAVYMVADPQCPFCHEAWKQLAPIVADSKVQLRVIMIAGLRGSLDKAVSILSRQDPGRAWLSGEGSVTDHPIKPGPLPGSKEWTDAEHWIEMNGAFAKRFDIRQTPFLVYVGTDGDVYFSLGIPADMNDFLSKA